ncbi:MAG: helix-turn-helix transcriptional regulator [Acidobacteriota bacterium]
MSRPPGYPFDHLGQALWFLRELRGLSQGELARECDVGRDKITLYEAGRVVPRLDTLARLIVGLDCNLDDFCGALLLMERVAEHRAAALEAWRRRQPQRWENLPPANFRGKKGLLHGALLAVLVTVMESGEGTRSSAEGRR